MIPVDNKDEKKASKAIPEAEVLGEQPDKAEGQEDEQDMSSALPDDLEAKLAFFEKRMKEKEDSGDTSKERKPSQIERLEKELEEKDQLLKEYIAEHKSAVQRFEESRVRLRQNLTEEIERGKRNLIQPFLDVIDDLERAIASATQGGSVEQLLEGVNMIRDRFLRILEEYGVQQIESVGQPFDPKLHEAIGTAPVQDKSQEDTVLHVVSQGYRVGEDLLRPARVIVGKPVEA